MEPRNFSWLSDNVCGFGIPYRPSEVEFLEKVAKLNHVITMCYEKPRGIDESKVIQWHHFPVHEFRSPTLETIHNCMSLIEEAESKGERVGVHCLMGQGRAGVILACYLVRKRGLSGSEAIKTLREMRPRSIESKEQENIILSYQESLVK